MKIGEIMNQTNNMNNVNDMYNINGDNERRYVCNGKMHTVKEGDTLYRISRMHNIPLGELIEANRNMNIYDIQQGDRICIPEEEVGDMSQNENSMQNDSMMGNNKNDSWSVYIVKDEDTLKGVEIKTGSIVVVPN